jgi:RNA polymerase sigma-70 factor (ECF subfamily)
MTEPMEGLQSWARLLVDHVSFELSDETRERVATLVADAWQLARSVHPEVEAHPDAFVAALARQLDGPDRVPETLAALRAADLYLAVACADGAKGALETFEREVMPAAAASLRRQGLAPSAVAEVQQALRERLFVDKPERQAKVRTYGGRGRLASWVRVAAIRLAHDLGESQDIVGDDALLQTLAPDGDPELAQLKEGYRAEFRLAFAEAVDALPARERTLLRQHWVDGLASHQLAPLYDVHRATVSRWVIKAQHNLVEQTREALGRRLGLDDAAVRSLVQFIQSRLDASVHRLLEEG